jgi:hypothetical protein
MTFRPWPLGIHRYMSLLAAIPLLLSGVSGMLAAHGCGGDESVPCDELGRR